jgi:hypothetical protein
MRFVQILTDCEKCDYLYVCYGTIIIYWRKILNDSSFCCKRPNTPGDGSPVSLPGDLAM